MKASEKVVCIKDVRTRKGVLQVSKGTIHTVHSIFTCGCGNTGLDLGIASFQYAVCRCGMQHLTNTLIAPKHHFRPVDWEDCREELIEEAMVKKIEVEPIKTPEHEV